MPAWIAGGASLVGSALGYFGAQNTNAQQIALAQQQMAFQKDLATNAVQYRVSDLKKAGLNPALAYGQGGAQAMPGAMAQLQNPGQSFQNLGQGVASGLQLNAQSAQIDQLKAQTDLLKNQAIKTAGADTDEARARIEVDNMQSRLLGPAQSRAADAAATLDGASQERVRQQIASGDIAAQIGLMRGQTQLTVAQRYMDIAIGKFNDMNAIEKQYGMPFLIQQLGYAVQSSALGLPEKRALANYYETTLGQQSFAQDQISRGVNTAVGVYKAFKPGVSSESMGGVNTTPGFGMGAGSPRWPVNP